MIVKAIAGNIISITGGGGKRIKFTYIYALEKLNFIYEWIFVAV